MSNGRYNVCLINSADPRGAKIGGISTYIRDYIFYHPEDMNLLFVGPDEIGDLKLGEINDIEFRGRKMQFLPLLRTETSVNKYAKSISSSETYQYSMTLLKNWSKLKKIFRDGKYSAEIRRVEFAPILWSMGVPFVQMVHVWGAKDKPMSALLGKHSAIRGLTEYIAAALAYKFYSVNSDMTAMYKEKFSQFARKFDTLTTWANTTVFAPHPFQFTADDKIKVVYVGRMDRFKRPDIMFQVIGKVAEMTGGKVEFHYIGDGDPSVFEGYEAAVPLMVRHGAKNSAQVGELLRTMHVGLLTSEFEGMPRFVLETLSSGRPSVDLHLPQLERVIKDGESGYLIARGDDQVEAAAQGIVDIYARMKSGAVTPASIAQHVVAFSPPALLGKIFNDHRHLHGLAPTALPASA
jgi:glycosyltransferase involved in cell wall biosynthesis